jgi:hypothetical protein
MDRTELKMYFCETVRRTSADWTTNPTTSYSLVDTYYLYLYLFYIYYLYYTFMRKGNLKSILVVEVVDSDFLSLAVGLRPSPDIFVDENKSERIVPFDCQDVIDHGVDPRRLSRPRGSRQ